MKRVIEKYKKGIFVYVIVNCFALVVNLFNVDYSTEYLKIGRTAYYESFHELQKSYFLTHNDPKIADKLWPLVNFKYSDMVITDYFPGGMPRALKSSKGFNGIFYQYDWSEFLLYIGLLVAFLVYKAYIATPKLKVPIV